MTLLNKSIHFFQTIVLSFFFINVRIWLPNINFLFCTEQTCMFADNNVLFGNFYLLINVPKGSPFNISAPPFPPVLLKYLVLFENTLQMCIKVSQAHFDMLTLMSLEQHHKLQTGTNLVFWKAALFYCSSSTAEPFNLSTGLADV